MNLVVGVPDLPGFKHFYTSERDPQDFLRVNVKKYIYTFAT
jgi:hypothetical protein